MRIHQNRSLLIEEQPLSSRQWAVLLLIVLLAFALRSYRLSLSGFLLDEAWLSVRASQIAHFKNFPLVGIRTSFGFRNPAFLSYLLAPVYAVTDSPLGAMFVVAMAASAAVGLTALTIHRLYGLTPAVFAATCMAFAPNAIEHSRRIWGHDWIVFWSAVGFYALVRGVRRGDARWYVLSMAAAVFAQAGHLSGVFLWIAPLSMLCILRPHRWLRALAWGLLIGAGVYLPWLLHDALSQNFDDLKMMFSLASGRSSGPGSSTPVPAVAAWIGQLSDAFHVELLGEAFPSFFSGSPVFSKIVVLWRVWVGGSVVAGLGCMLWVALRSGEREERVLHSVLLLTALAPVALFSILPVTSVPPYQLPALLVQVVALALAAHCLRLFCSRRLCLSLLLLFVLFHASVGTAYTLRLRHRLAGARFDDGTIMTLAAQTDAMRYIIHSAGDSDYALQQDIRPPEGGIDVWFVYLHYALTGNNLLPVQKPDAPLLFVIQTRPFEAFGSAEDLLAAHPPLAFGAVHVYRLEGADARMWVELTRMSVRKEDGR